MCLCRHQYRGIGNAVSQLSQCISCAGGDQKNIQTGGRADGFCLFNGKNRLVSRKLNNVVNIIFSISKTGVRDLHIGRENGTDIGSLSKKVSDLLFDVAEGTKRSSKGKTYGFSG